MKRFFKATCALLVLVCLCSLSIAVSAASDPEALQITDMGVTQSSQAVTLTMTLSNSGSAAIDEFGIALAFFDENTDRYFVYANTLDGYADEVCNWYYEPDEAIQPGENFYTEDVFSAYAGASIIAAAIRYYHVVDNDYISIPESDWQWRWPDYEADGSGTVPDFYTSPPDSVYDSTDYSYFGNLYNYYLLDDYNASYYGKNQGGEWITSVEAGSPAALAGLLAGDMVLFVDGMKPTENRYAVDYALADITSGEKVDWVVERDGVIYVTRIDNP